MCALSACRKYVAVQVATIPSTHYNMGGRAVCIALPLPRDGDGNAAEHVRVAIASVDGTVRVVNGFNPDSVVAAFATRKDIPFSAMAVVPIQNRDAIIAGAHCCTSSDWHVPTKSYYIPPGLCAAPFRFSE